MATVFIGLPVHNGDDFLGAAIDSILQQTFTDFRLLVSDNASTDGTPDLAETYARLDSRVEFHRHRSNLGAAPNFNYCVKQASGTYFKWMAHDDLCEPTYLERCVAVMESDRGVAICHARAACIDDSGTRTGSYSKEWDLNDRDPVVRFRRAIALDHACVSIFGVMRLDLLKQTPMIAPFVGSDRPLLAEFALHGSIEYVPETLFLWRHHGQRSVRRTRSNRVAWFDQSASALTGSLYFRQLLANEETINRSQLAASDKLRAQWALVSWVLRNCRRFASDVRVVAGFMIRKRRGG